MAPPKAVCSVYAEYLATKQQLLQTISDIKAALSKALKIKYSILYGLASVADAAVAQVTSAATSVASTIAQAVLSQASSLTSAAIEAALAPLLKILMSGPEAVFGLVSLPLNKAIQAADKEAYFLQKSKSNLDIIISIFSKWTVEFGGERYAQKMREALPFIEAAIGQCSTVIDKLEASSASGLTAQFDEQTYNTMRANISAAIEITKSDSIILNKDQLELNIANRADTIAAPRIDAIKKKYKEDKESLTKKFIESDRSPLETSTYSVKLKILDSKKKIDIEGAKLRAVKEATLDKSTYAGILKNPADEFSNDMDILGGALANFGKYTALAYVQYKASQAYTISAYNIKALINELLKSVIELIGKAGNGAGKSVQVALRFTNEILIQVDDMYSDALSKYNSPTETISSTGMSVKLGAGNGMLIAADSAVAGTITKSMIDLINADETLTVQQSQMQKLFDDIHDIPDWDGRLGIWGVSPLIAGAAPYPRLISSTTAVIGTMLSIGLVPSADAIEVNRKRISENSKIFRQISRHNAYVSSALKSYTPPTSPYVEEFRKAVSPAIMALFLSGPVAFNCIALVKRLAGYKIAGALDDMGRLEQCKIMYKDLFPKSVAKAQILEDSEKLPVQLIPSAADKIEANEHNHAAGLATLQTAEVLVNEDSDLKGAKK